MLTLRKVNIFREKNFNIYLFIYFKMEIVVSVLGKMKLQQKKRQKCQLYELLKNLQKSLQTHFENTEILTTYCLS